MINTYECVCVSYNKELYVTIAQGSNHYTSKLPSV